MELIRERVKKIIYAFGALIILLILVRFGFKLFGVSSAVSIGGLIYQLTEPLVAPFRGIAMDIASGSISIESTSIISLVMWLAFILIAAEVVTAFLYDRVTDIFINLVDACFKFFEFFLLARLLMRGFGVQLGVNNFVDVIYRIAGIVYEPFAGLAPGINIGVGILELSTLIALILVIFLDIVIEGILKSVLETDRPVKLMTATTPDALPASPVYFQPTPSAPPPQINVIVPPSPSAQQVYVHNAQTGETMRIDPAQQQTRVVIDAPTN
jgi:uncharacterized protein YggT (Ycf19 family)